MTEIHKPPPRTVFISSQARLLVGFTLLFTVVFAGAFYWFYTYSTKAAIKRIEQDVLNTVQGAADGIDVDQFIALVNEGTVRADGYTDDPRYWAHVDWLAKVSKINPRAQIYTYIAGTKSTEVIFIGSTGAVVEDPSGAPPPWGVKFKEPYTSVAEGNANLLTGLDHIGASIEIYSDQWGSWMSGYGPIVNAKGEKVGAIGVDIPADYVKEVQQGILQSMFVAFAITYIILFALVYVISLLFTRPIVALTRTAERIGDGDYEQDFTSLKTGRLRNEFSSLADVFEIMVKKVYQREQTLRHQVQELTIIIDQKKRESRVTEIVESDFFNELKQKATKLREENIRKSSQNKE